MGIIDDMVAILRADDALMTILPGGVLTEPLDSTRPGQEAAWQVGTSGVKRLRPCAVLLPPQEVDAPFGQNPERRLDTDLWPELYLYADRGQVAATFDPADERAMELLHQQHIGLADITATGYRAAPLEADELPGDVWNTFRRYRVQRSRHIAEV